MASDPGHRNGILLVGAGVIGLVLIGNIINPPEPQPKPSPSPTKRVSDGPSDLVMMTRAEREVRAMLKDPDSAVFSDMRVRRSPLAVCGYVNSKNSFGGMSGRQRFISGSVTALEEQMEAGAMNEVWAKVC